MMNRKCTHMSFSATFNPIVDLTQKFINNAQHILNVDFASPNILPVPDVVQDDVPRVVVNSKGSHSQVVLSKINCSITTNFDDDFSGDLEKCNSYFDERVKTINRVVNSLENDDSLKLKFMGITTELVFDKNDAVKLILENVTKVQADDLCDIDLQITRIVEDRYYVNIRVSNSRLFNQNINPLECGFLENEYHDAIRVTIDVNNRYAFSKGIVKIQECSLAEIEKIKKLSEDTVNSLSTIFGEGVFSE